MRFTGIVNLQVPEQSRFFADPVKQAAAEGIRLFFAGVLRNHRELSLEAGIPAETPAAALLLKLFQRWGEKSFQKLDGNFVFALWKVAEKKLLLGRDRLGQKFLFHAHDAAGQIIFSDSLLEVVCQSGVNKEYDLQALADYFALGYCPAPATIYRSIRKIASATILTFDATGICDSTTYWQPQFLPKLKISFSDAVIESHRLLEQAIKRCLCDHSKVNFLLSGGIDSGLVLGLAAPLLVQEGQAISIAFKERLYDESGLAAQTAARHGVEQIVRKVDAAEIRHIAQLLAAAGEPFADSSLLPTFLALQEASKSARAVFAGDGGDEFFCGYRRMQFIAWRSCLSGVPGGISQGIAKILRPLLPAPVEQRSKMANLSRLLEALALPLADAYMSFQQIFSPQMREELLRQTALLDYRERWRQTAAEAQCHDQVEKFAALDILTYLPENTLRKCDIANLGIGIDMLCPLLDADLVEFSLCLPRSHKLGLFECKRPLRAIGQTVLPKALLQQRKRGFGVPVASWFRNDLKEEIQELAASLADWDTHGWLNGDYVQRLVREHLDGRADHAARLWSLFCLKVWLEQQKS